MLTLNLKTTGFSKEWTPLSNQAQNLYFKVISKEEISTQLSKSEKISMTFLLELIQTPEDICNGSTFP